MKSPSDEGRSNALPGRLMREKHVQAEHRRSAIQVRSIWRSAPPYTPKTVAS
jgi:hypothetical protein